MTINNSREFDIKFFNRQINQPLYVHIEQHKTGKNIDFAVMDDKEITELIIFLTKQLTFQNADK